MPTPFPDTIQLGAFTYELRFLDDIRDESDEEAYGRISFKRCLIELRSDLSIEVAIQTLLHECLHALIVHIGNPSNITEGTVDALAYGLVGFMVDNPSIMELIRIWSTTTTAPTAFSAYGYLQELSQSLERPKDAN